MKIVRTRDILNVLIYEMEACLITLCVDFGSWLRERRDGDNQWWLTLMVTIKGGGDGRKVEGCKS